MCQGSRGSCGFVVGEAEECRWLSTLFTFTKYIGIFKVPLVTSACQLTCLAPQCGHHWVRMHKLFCRNWQMTGYNTWTQTEELFQKPGDGVVWLRVCGSTGNNEMLPWNMRNHTNIRNVFFFTSWNKYTLYCVIIIFYGDDIALQIRL